MATDCDCLPEEPYLQKQFCSQAGLFRFSGREDAILKAVLLEAAPCMHSNFRPDRNGSPPSTAPIFTRLLEVFVAE
jgi:hypothetical protein